MTGFCTYDSDTPDQVSYDFHGIYSLKSISMTIGNYTFTHDPILPDPAVFNISTFGHRYDIHSYTPRFDGIVYVDGVAKTFDDVDLDYFQMSLLYLIDRGLDITDDLPGSLDEFMAFNSPGTFWLHTEDHIPGFHVEGEITSINVIPEPATFLLAALGSLILARRR